MDEEISSQRHPEKQWVTPPVATADSCVIQCPSCQTRFSLPVAALEGHADPRFHCSQCDTIFRVENESESEQQTQNQIQEEPPPAPQFVEFQHQVIPEIVASAPTEPIPDTYVSNAFEEDFEPQVVPNDPPPVVQTSSSRSFDIPRIVESGWTIGAPHESAPVEEQADVNTVRAEPAAKRDLLEPKQISLGLEQSSTAAGESSPEKRSGAFDVPKSSTFGQFPSFGIKKKMASATSPGPSPMPSPSLAAGTKKGEVSIQKRQLLLDSVKRMKFSLPTGRWQAAMIIAAPLLLFCVALVALSSILKLNPLHSEETITSIIPGLPRTAPPGLAVIDAHLRKLTLDSGDKIFAISGRVKNNSGKQLRQVHLDGLVFDGSGKVIAQKKVLVSSPLAQSKIKSLSLEMIEDIEANASKGKTTVKDGETAPFVVTFNPQEVSGGKFFTTRIHSVK